MKLGLRRHAESHHPRKGSDPLLFFSGLPSRIVFGAIYNDTTVIDAGSGDWSVVVTSLNVYTFTVSPAFSAPILTVIVTPGFNGDANDPYLATVDTSLADTDTFVVKTFNFIGDPFDTNFAFAAFEAPA